jgi:pyruvate dehydrogenase E2 component (dihydrolipoamide acetyltransferase)
MPTNVTMPQMGESIFEGTITKWLKKVGDKVNRDEPLFEISTEKVDSEIPSPAGGIVKEILFPEGSVVQVSTVVAIIVGEEEGAEIKAEEPVAPAQKKPAMESAVMPPPTELKTPAPAPVEETPKVEVETEPEVPVVGALADITPPAPTQELEQPKDLRTSPLVRRLAREHNVNLALVKGTGLDGRITKQDILDYIERRSPAHPEAIIAAIPETPLPTAPVIEEAPLEAWKQVAKAEPATAKEAPVVQPPVATPALATQVTGDIETVIMTPMRKAIAEHMVLSKHTSPHVHTVFEVDFTSVIELRDRYKADFERKEGIKLTITPFIAKALVEAVRDFPVLNCSVQGENILFKKPVNLGIAVALDNGLIVPVVKDAHLKSFTGLALGIQDLASRARTKRLRTDEVQNGTITITNPGSFGELFSTPIINQPQVAILSVGSIEKRPVVINDMIAIRSMGYLTLAFDHRVVDGAVADQFMAKIKAKLESWRQRID